jgi:hypothetical protein
VRGLHGDAMGAPHRSQHRMGYVVRRHGIFDTKRCGDHRESYLGFGGCELAVPRLAATACFLAQRTSMKAVLWQSSDQKEGWGGTSVLRRSSLKRLWSSRGFALSWQRWRFGEENDSQFGAPKRGHRGSFYREKILCEV